MNRFAKQTQSDKRARQNARGKFAYYRLILVNVKIRFAGHVPTLTAALIRPCLPQKHRPTSSKRAKRILEASPKLFSLCARTLFLRPRLPPSLSHFALADHHPHPIFVDPIEQNDVEEYLGGPDTAVERVLSAFQDALACVTRQHTHATVSYLCSLKTHLRSSPYYVGSTAIWTAT